jgi:hypothetical protein
MRVRPINDEIRSTQCFFRYVHVVPAYFEEVLGGPSISAVKLPFLLHGECRAGQAKVVIHNLLNPDALRM